MKQNIPIIDAKTKVFLENTLKLLNRRKARKNRTEVCNLTKISKS